MYRILVVEDNVMLRGLVSEILTPEGYTTVEASNGLEALSAWNACDGAFDAVLTDIEMPKMDGQQLSEALWSLGTAVPIIYMSGRAASTVMEEHIREGRARYIAKPFNPADLKTIIASVLNGHPSGSEPVREVGAACAEKV